MAATTYVLHERIAVTICSLEQARSAPPWNPKKVQLFSCPFEEMSSRCAVVNDEAPNTKLSGLSTILKFCATVEQSFDYQKGKMVVVCAGQDPLGISQSIFVVGGFMILSLGSTLEAVVKALVPLQEYMTSFEDNLTVEDSLGALYHAKENCGWLELRGNINWFSSRCNSDCRGNDGDYIDTEEYLHYDDRLNGNIHVLVPDKFLIFNCPEDVQDRSQWVDIDGERNFSAAYYADVFQDFDVQLVVRACDSDYDMSAFTAQGIEVEDLFFHDSAELPFSTIDRFLSLAKHLPGAMAVHGSRDGLGMAGTLIAAHLISCHHFPAKQAIAWVRMIHPAALPLTHQLFLAENEAHVRRHCHSDLCLSSYSSDLSSSSAVGQSDGSQTYLGMGLLRRSISEPKIFDFLGDQLAADQALSSDSVAASWLHVSDNEP